LAGFVRRAASNRTYAKLERDCQEILAMKDVIIYQDGADNWHYRPVVIDRTSTFSSVPV
jgi:hypothetical protein